MKIITEIDTYGLADKKNRKVLWALKTLSRKAVLIGTTAFLPLFYTQAANAQNFAIGSVNETTGITTGTFDFDENLSLIHI